MNITQEKIPSKSRNTECRRLRIEYHQEADCFCIAHYGEGGVLLSEARLAPEEALDYARTINEVYDDAVGI